MPEKPTYRELLERIQELEQAEFDRTRSEAALRDSEERFRNMIEGSIQGILIHRDHKPLFVNQAWASIHGYTTKEILKMESVVPLVSPKDQTHMLEYKNARVRGEDAPTSYEYRAVRKNGSLIWVENRVMVVNWDGEPAIQTIIVDITERKQAVEKIEKQYRFLKTLFDAIPCPFFLKDIDTKYLGCSPSYAEIFGVSTEEIVGKRSEDIFSDDIAAVHNQTDQELFQNPGTQVYEYQFKYADGSLHDKIVSKATYSDDNGKLAGMVGFYTDITDRRRAEEALRESEERYRTLFETMIQGVVYQDAEGNIISANHAAERILGLTLDQMRGRTSIDPSWRSIHEDGSDFSGDTHPSMVALKSGKKVENVIMGVFKPSIGDHTWININAVPLNREGENKPHQVYTTFHDITGRKKAEEALRESEERYRILFELSPDAIIIWQDEKVAYANSQAIRLLGATKLDQLVDIPIWEIHHPDYHTELKERYQYVHETGRTLSPIEYQFVRLDGQTIYVEATATMIQYRNRPAGLSVYRDITERRQLEAEKENLETRLQQAQKMESIGTLAGGIAHDFNNILSPIIGNIDLAMMDIDDSSPVKINLREILKAGNRAKDLTQQILAFSRQRDQEKIPVKLSIIIKEITKLLRSSIPTTIDIRYNIGVKTDTIFADPTQIHQVILNLCTNASQAMREKGGVLEIELDELYLDSSDINEVEDLNPGSYLRLTVKDTGYGIESEDMDKIFEPYFTTKQIGEGTGLGLAVSHGIVKSHGGDIMVESKLGEGSSFRVLFPKYGEDVLVEKESMEQLRFGTERILLVDDVEATLDIFQAMLNRLGYEVTAKTNSVEALEDFRNRPEEFDLVVTDQTMPNMTGKDLAKELMAIRPDIPIILCTGFSEKINKQEAEVMGIRAFIMKPIVLGDIANTIRLILDNE